MSDLIPKAKLDSLLDLLDAEHEDYTALLDVETGEAVIMEAWLVTAAKEGGHKMLAKVPEWQIPHAELARVIAADTRGRFIKGPGKYDFHEYRHMERFIGTVENEAHAEQLWRAIKGPGAFRHFKDTADRLDLLDAWFSWRDEAKKKYVTEWAKTHGIELEH